MESEVYVWGYNGLGTVDDQAKQKRYFASPHRKHGCKSKTRLPNSAPMTMMTEKDIQCRDIDVLRCLFSTDFDKIMNIIEGR